MAMQMDTGGWQPQFELSALRSGEKYALAEAQQDEELRKSRLENYLKGRTVDNDIVKSNLEGARAGAMNTPDMLDWHTRGYKGQMQSQDAAGRFAQDTLANKTLQGNQEYKEKYAKGQVGEQEQLYQLERILKALAGADPAQQDGGQIGFDMQPQSEFNPNYGNEGRSVPILKTEKAMKDSMGTDYRSPEKSYDLETIDKEIARTKDPKIIPILQAERARIQQALAAGGGGEAITPNAGNAPVFSNMQQPAPQNRWLQGMDMTSPRHQNVMGAFMDTPEFRQKMAASEHKTDAQMEQAQLRAQAIKEAQAAKVKLDNPKYKEQLAAAFVTADNPQATPDARAKAKVFIDYHRQMLLAANPNNYQEGVDLSQYGVKTKPAPTAQIPQPGSTTAQRKPLAEF